MRILLLSGARGIPLYGPSGASAHLRGIAQAFGRLGHTVTVATPRLSDHRGAVEDPIQAKVVVCEPHRWAWMGRWRERGEVWDARRLVRALEPADLIYERYSLFCDAGRSLSRRWGVPRIVELNAPLSLERARYERVFDRRYARRKERQILHSADRIVAVSGWLAAWATALGCRAVRHVPNGVSPRQGDRAGTRQKLGLRGPVIGFVGTMKPWHGIDRLPGLLNALPEATGLLVGTGPCLPPKHPRIRAVGRAEAEELADLVAAMDVGLAPYRADAPKWFCPLKILDYRAQGVPVVAAKLGDSGLLLQGGGGETVAGDALPDWVGAIRRQLEAPRIPWVRSWTEVASEALDGYA